MEPPWIARLLNARLSGRSRNQYVQVLGYAAIWYRARYGQTFPLAHEPARPLDASEVEAFVDDQLPVFRDGRAVCAMHPSAYDALRDRGYFRGHVCPSEATSRWRLKVLSTCQKQLRPGYYGIARDVAAGMVRISAAWQRVRAGIGDRQLAAASPDIVGQMRDACPDTRDGLCGRAMVTLLKVLTTSQLARLRLGDLAVGQIPSGDSFAAAVDITIRRPTNVFQRRYPRRRLLGSDAEAVTAWWKCRAEDAQVSATEPLSPAVPYLVRKAAGGDTTMVDRGWVLMKFHQLAMAAGVEVAGQSYRPSMIRGLGDSESFEYRQLVMIANQLGLERAGSVYRILDLGKS